MSGTEDDEDRAPTVVANGGLDRLLDMIVSTMPAVSAGGARMELWNAVEQFCIRSTYWREEVAWTMAPGAHEVDLNPVSAEAVGVWLMHTTGLQRWNVRPLLVLRDVGSSEQLRSGCATVACKPSGLNQWLPDFVADMWADTLVDGAKARLYSQPAKPYSAPPLGDYHMKRFMGGIKRARDNAQRGNAWGGTSGWRFPYFARGRAK